MRQSDDGTGGRSALDERIQRDRRRQKLNQQRVRKPPRRKRSTRGGILFIALGLLVFGALLVNQLYQIQVLAYAENAELAAGQHYKKVTEQPTRGRIVDRNGIELAGTTYVYRIGITPKDVRSISENLSKDTIMAEFARCLNLPLAEVKAAFADEKASYVQLKKEATKDENEALKAYRNEHSIGGVRVDSEPRRFYTNSTLAPQVVGYTKFDSASAGAQSNLIGQLGIELSYNDILTGQPGYTYTETDNYSRGVLPFSVPTSLRAQNGSNVVLNLDSNIQKIVQEELENAIKVYDITAGGEAIVMNPYTGAVLAMASYPWFDLRNPTAVPAGKDPKTWDTSKKETIEYLSKEIWRNRAISDTYEPGSCFKALTASIAFEEGLTREEELFSDAPMKVSGWTISCSSRTGHGTETMQTGFYRSCNPVFAQLALRTGVSKYYDYIRAYGFYGTTGIDLPGEGSGILHKAPTQIDLATLSYGESSTVTPIQLATAYCALANGGTLVKPQVVKAITDEQGNIIKDYPAESVRKVVSAASTARVLKLMEGVVLYGTGSAAYTEGYRIAGKSSTATDDNGDHTISFGGIAPADNPELVVLVVLNKPRDKKMTSTGAARTVGLIVNRTLEYMGTVREYSDQDISSLNKKIAVPAVTGMSFGDARRQLAAKGFTVEAGDASMSDATMVRSQFPDANTQLHKKGVIVLYPQASPQPAYVAVPDFSGKNINEALRAAAESGLNITFDGSCLGVVVSQDPQPTFEAPENPLGGAATGTTPTGTAGSATTGKTDANAGRLRRGSIIKVRFEPPVEELPDSPATSTTATTKTPATTKTQTTTKAPATTPKPTPAPAR